MDLTWMLVLVCTVIVLVATHLLFAFVRRNSIHRHENWPPGPKPWPVVGNLWEIGENVHQTFYNLSRQYGPVFSLSIGSVPIMVVNSPATAEQIVKHNDFNFARRAQIIQAKEVAMNQNTLGSSSPGPQWRTLRKIFTKEFITLRRIQSHEEVRHVEVQTGVQMMIKESTGGKPTRMDLRIADHVANMVLTMVGSKRLFGPQAENNFGSMKFRSLLRELNDLGGIFHLGDYIPFFRVWDVQRNKMKMRKAQSKMTGFVRDIIEKRRREYEKEAADGNDRASQERDFLDMLINRSNKNDEQTVTEENKLGVLQSSMAGVDSTTSMIEWCLVEAMKHSDKLKRAQEELDIVVGRNRLVKESDLAQLPYAMALVKETYRLHPPAPLMVPHSPAEDCNLEGFLIPANSHVFVNLWASGRDPTVWHKPLEFYPERFLDSPIDVMGHHRELLPFGSGRRLCPGLPLANTMVQYYFAMIIQCCNLAFPPDRTAEYTNSIGAGTLLSRLDPSLEAIVTPRLPMHVIYDSSVPAS